MILKIKTIEIMRTFVILKSDLFFWKIHMKKIYKRLFILLFWIFAISGISMADYTFFYGIGCPHCANVEAFFEETNAIEKFDIQMKEVYQDQEGQQLFLQKIKEFNIDISDAWVPFLLIEDGEWKSSHIGWDKPIIAFFEEKIAILEEAERIKKEAEAKKNIPIVANTDTSGTIEKLNTGENIEMSWAILENNNKWTTQAKWWFFGKMLPAALADSINPCAFAVMLLLLVSILSKGWSRRKVLLSGFLFSLSIFLSYLAMWFGLYSALASTQGTWTLKLVVGILWLIVWLANLKDYFRYWKGFVMEIPLSWRPNMQKLINNITSPLWAFLVGFVVSLFLLPCSSGPYIVIIGLLRDQEIGLWTYLFFILYNLIFILPMFIISFLVGMGYKSAEQLANIKKDNTKLIHLIVGLLMIWLWLYVLLSM